MTPDGTESASFSTSTSKEARFRDRDLFISGLRSQLDCPCPTYRTTSRMLSKYVVMRSSAPGKSQISTILLMVARLSIK